MFYICYLACRKYIYFLFYFEKIFIFALSFLEREPGDGTEVVNSDNRVTQLVTELSHAKEALMGGYI